MLVLSGLYRRCAPGTWEYNVLAVLVLLWIPPVFFKPFRTLHCGYSATASTRNISSVGIYCEYCEYSQYENTHNMPRILGV